MKQFSAVLLEYKYDKANSSPKEEPSFSSPGQDEEIAIKISKIAIEDKTEILQGLKTGQTIEFRFGQTIDIPVKTKNIDEDTRDVYVEGVASGEILEIENLDSSIDDYQEIFIILKDGFADKL